MKKVLLILTSLLFSVGTIGCIPIPNIRESMLNASNDDKIADERMKRIITALENKDRKALKAMFSVQAKEDAIDLDDGIEYIINFYQGKMISFDGVYGVDESFNGDNKKTTITGKYNVETDKEQYYCSFIEKTNTADDSENGLYSIQILKETKKNEKMFWMNITGTHGGVLQPKILEAYDYMYGIVRVLGNQDSDMLQELFSVNTTRTADGLGENAIKAVEVFQGHMESSKEIETTVEKDGDNIVTKGYYEVTTKNYFNKPEEAGTYLVYFVHKRNEVDPDEDGLYTLEIAEKVDENTELSRIDKAGIIVS